MTDTPFVGRRAELAELASELEEAKRGRGSVHLLAGEGGVGKSRLTAVVGERAREQGFSTVIGRAFPVERGIPYALFADAFVPLLRDLPPATFQTLSRGSVGELALLFPALRTDAAPARGGTDGDLTPRLLNAFGQFVQRLARRAPLLVVLENLQWADPSSFDLLHFLSRSASEHPLMLLGTYNETQRDSNSSLLATEQSLRSLGVLRQMDLQPLTLGETADFLTQAYGASARDLGGFTQLLHDRTRGNPFFMEETLKALVLSGSLRRDGERWIGWGTDRLELPRSIRDVLQARFLGLTETAKQVAVVASVVGAQTPDALLERVVPAGREAILAAVEELLRDRMLVEHTAGGALAYEFSHPLMQEMLYGELARARARQVHAAIADAMEAMHGARALEHADELAVHFLRAQDPAQEERACRYLTAAGESALARGADREAAESLAAALGIAESRGDSAARERLLDQLARARHRLGDYAGAAALWSEALGRAQNAGDRARIAVLERQLGVAALRRGDSDHALRHHERAVDAAITAADDALIASVRLARSVALLEVGRGDDAEQDLRAVLVIAERSGSPQLLARVHHALQLLACWRGPSADARVHGERALAFAIAAGDQHAEWSAQWAMAVQCGLNGDAAGTREHIAEARRLADELRSPLLRLWIAEVEIEYHSGVGEWDAALALTDRTIADARAFGQRALLPRLLVWSALIRLGRGEFELGRAQVDEAWTLSGAGRAVPGATVSMHTVVPAHVGRAYWHLFQLEYAEALRVAEAGLAIAERTGYTAWAMHRLMPVAAEAAIWVKDWERAERYGTRLRETAERLAHPLGIAWSDACFALIRMMKGDKAGAVTQLRAAADALDAIPFVDHAARLRRKLADAYNDSGDPASAIPELKRCHEMFRQLGAKPALDEVRQKMRELGAKPPTVVLANGGGVGALTARETEIARLVTARKSNKEIGVALGISDRTVSTHLSNIFVKLEVDSRGALADMVRERGLL